MINEINYKFSISTYIIFRHKLSNGINEESIDTRRGRFTRVIERRKNIKRGRGREKRRGKGNKKKCKKEDKFEGTANTGFPLRKRATRTWVAHVRDIGVMGQLVSYCGSSVRRRKVHRVAAKDGTRRRTFA